MSALRAAWIPKCVLYHLRCAYAKLEWRIPHTPLQCDYRRLQAQWDIAASAAGDSSRWCLRRPSWRSVAMSLQVHRCGKLRSHYHYSAYLTAIAHAASGDALPLSRGLPMSALRAAWSPKCVFYHLRWTNAKLEWHIPLPPLQSDYRRLQAQWDIAAPAAGDSSWRCSRRPSWRSVAMSLQVHRCGKLRSHYHYSA
ncbi:hypothetical protein MRX96_014400 [Rhipicephalus microplus]